MDDKEDVARHLDDPRGSVHAAHHRKQSARFDPPPGHGYRDVGDYDSDEEEEEEEDDGDGGGSSSSESRGKRRRLDKIAPGGGFEIAPRAPPPAQPPPRSGGATASRGASVDWSEDSTFTLLDAWGELYVQNGRKSLRSDEWIVVADRVSRASCILRSNAQCRNRVDTLKKKYKKEKSQLSLRSQSSSSSWVYFKKMDFLMSPASPPPSRPLKLSGEVNGEGYIFPGSSNGMAKRRESPVDPGSDAGSDDEDDSEGLPPMSPRAFPVSGSFGMLAEAIRRFGEVYERMENNKRQQMAELERLRKEFLKGLEVQKRQILERAHAEIAKMRQEEEGEDGREKDDDYDDEDEEDD